MKKIYLFLTLALALAIAPIVKAAPLSASTATQLFSTTVLTTAYSELFSAAGVVKAVKGMTISNSATVPVYVAVGGSGSEVVQMVVPASSSAPVYYPMVVSQNQRISIKGSTGTVSAGALQMNLLYN